MTYTRRLPLGVLLRAMVRASVCPPSSLTVKSWASSGVTSSGEVELYYRTSHRLLVFRFPDGRDRIFDPRLAARPDPEAGWSDWRPVDFVGLPNQPQTVKPGPEDPYELRYRLRVWGSE